MFLIIKTIDACKIRSAETRVSGRPYAFKPQFLGSSREAVMDFQTLYYALVKFDTKTHNE